MTDVINKAFLAGLGAINLTREKLESVVDELVKKGELARGDKSGILEGLSEEVEKRRDELKSFVRKEVQKVLKSLDVPSRDEVDALKEEIERMRGGKDKSKATSSE